MKTPRVPLALLCLLPLATRAQNPTPAPPAVTAPATVASATATANTALRTDEELEQLLGPIALYPDALIALILPASTVPAEIVLAARHVRDNPNDRSQIEHRAWDESVKSLTHYAEVLKWMDENLEWTRQVGEAFVQQPADVMQAVQRLRAKAKAAGTLVDTPQQQVLAEPEVIRIVPAQRDVIYVPHYEPEVVFVDRPVYYNPSFVTFGVGVPVGSWLAFDCDWRRRVIWHGDRHRRWVSHDWRRPVVSVVHTPAPKPHGHGHGHGHVNSHRAPPVRQWCPPPQAVRPSFSVEHHPRHTIARPTPIGSLGHHSSRHHRSSASSMGPRPAPSLPFSVRRTTTPSLPAVNPLPRTFATQPQREYPGPRPARGASTNAFSVQPAVVPPVAAPVNPAPTVRHSPGFGSSHTRRIGGDSSHSRDSRVRTRTHPAPSPAAIPRVPALPMASHHRSIAPAGPVAPARSHSRAQSHSFSQPRALPAPAAVPALPVARAAAPAAIAAPAPASAPQAAAPGSSGRPQGYHRGSRGNGGRHEH